MFTLVDNNNYTPGIHKTTLKSIENNLVDLYPNSTTRRRNFESFVSVLSSELFSSLKPIIRDIWFDGSFCSAKANPNDIDAAIIFEINTPEDLDKYLKIFGLFHNETNENLHDFYKKRYSDLYIVMHIDSANLLLKQGELQNNNVIISIANQSIDNYNYWKEWFGTDRSNNKKAIYSVDFREELIPDE